MEVHLSFEERGYAVIEEALDARQCAVVSERVSMGATRVGSRNLLYNLWCVELALCLKGRAEIAVHLPVGAVAVQCTLFDKSPVKNWLVPLHQDLSIPVRERIVHADFVGWSEKEGVLFVQPPVAVLQSLVAVRVHLDEAGPGSGALRVVPGSHRGGRLSEAEARRRHQANGEVECFAKQGDAFLMRPLLLHASSKATEHVRRRVLHFLFGPPGLPYGLRWNHAV